MFIQIQQDMLATRQPVLSPKVFAGSGQPFNVRAVWSLERRWPIPSDEEQSVIDEIGDSLPYWDGKVGESSGVLFRFRKEMPAYIAYLLLNNAYEYGDIELIRQYVKEGDRPIMFGVGMGVVAAALGMMSKHKVVGVDANPDLESWVADTAELNHTEIEFVHGALSDVLLAEAIPFTISKEFWSSSINEKTRLPDRIIMVPTLDFHDEIIKAGADTVFIDVEGAETFLSETIIPLSVKKLFVEIHSPNLGNKISAEIMNRLWGQNFDLVDSRGLTSFWIRRS